MKTRSGVHGPPRRFRKAPIVIGGCPRSGTSLLLAILSANPEIYCVPDEAWAFYDTTSLAEFERYVDEFLWQHLPAGLEDRYSRWCEKTPRNVLAFENVISYFGPDTRLIHIVRDGRDVVVSRHPQDPTKHWVEPWMWTWYAGEGARLESHPQVLTVRYEDLVRDYASAVTRLFDFLGEDPTGALGDWPARATLRRHSAWFDEVRPVDSDSIGNWMREPDQEAVRHLTDDPKARDLLAHFGYLERRRGPATVASAPEQGSDGEA